jgi:hypothetical protein
MRHHGHDGADGRPSAVRCGAIPPRMALFQSSIGTFDLALPSIRLKSITQKVSNIELSFAPVHATLKD